MIDCRTIRAALIAIALTSVGCKAKLGDACSPGQATCQDDATALVCQAGKYVGAACASPAGCRTAGDVTTCDFRGASVAAACIASVGVPGACADDGKSMWSCVDFAVRHDPCDGPKGCRATESRIQCDALPPTPKPGDPCLKSQEGDMRCAAGDKSYVRCAAGTYVLASLCRGPNGCKPIPELDTVGCDVAFGEEGDVCLSGETCTADGVTLLECTESKLIATRKCRGPHGCKETRVDKRDCDDSISQVGDACNSG